MDLGRQRGGCQSGELPDNASLTVVENGELIDGRKTVEIDFGIEEGPSNGDLTVHDGDQRMVPEVGRQRLDCGFRGVYHRLHPFHAGLDKCLSMAS